MNDAQSITGIVWAVFGHRLAIEGENGRVLADLGPKGTEGIAITEGDTITVTGEPKPSEMKVTSITLADGMPRAIAWPKKPHEETPHGADKHHESADAAAIVAAVEAEGFTVEGEPKRKPKHFEILGSKDGVRHEIHVALDGKFRHAKPVAA